VNPTIFIAKRFLKSENNFAGKYTGVVAVIGIAIGCFSLIVSMAVLNGFETKITGKIIGVEGDLRVEGDFISKYSLSSMDSIVEIDQYMPFISGKGIALNSENETAFINIKAVLMDSLLKFYTLGHITHFEGNIFNSAGQVYIGESLANKLQLEVGDEIRFVNLQSMRLPIGFPLQVKGNVAGIFSSKVLDFDDRYAFISLEMGRHIFSMSDGFNGIDIRCKSDIYSKKMKNDLKLIYRNIGSINSWEDQHLALVQAMKLEKKAAVLVLSLIIVVACFNLISNLILIIRQKWRELGILQVMGYSKKNIKRIVFNHGMFLGCLGCLAGTLIGGVLVWFQSSMAILPLPKDVYFMESLPMNLSIYEFIFVPTLAIIFVSGASYLAAKRAILITPINAIKLEK